ncbi:telomere-associated protein RIF1-like isoform X3 [Stylophora pistillata]|uniref:telomere-associated protein RIF1-like isoform X3 n=1 Tax=Stylophora pistillata TaxID=50429 RepID=UPI000C048D3F|nr:telomere-associated protein RIF1-like isoform X3 [Stylophora pistillata]
MVTIPECEGLFEPLLLILEDNMAASDDQVDAYLRMTERLREEEDVFVRELLNLIERVIVIFRRDIQSDKSDLCQASLQALGHCLYQEQIASSICLSDGQVLIQGLLSQIKESEDKGICTRALWCLAKQNLDSAIINTKLESILITLESVITKDLQSVTVDHEALCVIDRLLQQLPKNEMIKTVDTWAKLVFPLLVSSAIKVCERALVVMYAGLEHLMLSQDRVIKILVPLLKGSLLKEFPKMCSENKGLFVLKCWCCIVQILGETLHRGGSLINDLLKLVEQGFRDPSDEVQVMSFSAWNILIDNFALSSGVISSPKRVKLILTPLRNLAVKERSETVEAARLSTWWHFVCSLGPKVQELFDQVCTPLLQFVFGTAIDQVSSLKTKEGLSELKCPPTPTNNKLLSDMMAETPKSSIRRSLKDMGTPRTPTVLNASFAKPAKQKLLGQGCEILMELLKTEDTCFSTNPDFIVSLAERLQMVTFKKPEEFKKHAPLLTSAVREAFKALGKDLTEPLGVKVWNLLVKRIEKVVEKGPLSECGEFLLPLLAVMQELVDSSLMASSLVLKMLEALSKLPAEVLSHHMASLHSRDNPQGSPALLLIQLLFTPQLLESIWQEERFHLAFEHLVDCGMIAASGQLFFLQTVLNLLKKGTSAVTGKETLWRLWSCVVNHLSEHIQKTNDVNQGDALEHDFSTLYLALIFPVKHLLDTNLPQALSKEVGKALVQLYRSFSRAAALVPTAEANICCEELCSKILSAEGDWKSKDIVFVDSMVSLIVVAIECLDFSTPSLFALATTASGKSPNTPPTKWNKRLQRPMRNMTSMVSVVSKLLSACERTRNSKDSTQNLGILTAILTNLIDKLSYLFVHISGAATITAVLKTLTPTLVHYIENAHTSTKSSLNTESSLDKRLFSARVIQKIEKLWSDILTCLQSRHGGPYNSDLLSVMSPLLQVTLGHPKRSIKNHAVIFWNATFAHSKTLEYPETLRPVLQIARDKMSLTLPGWENIKISDKDAHSDLESEELTQNANLMKPLPYGILGSPQRRKHTSVSGGSPQLKGSFLHKALSIEKVLENASPKRISRSPKVGRPRNSPANTHVRRKLPLSKFDDDDQEYVMIAPSPKKKRVLTEHQKEILRSRGDVPTLYNALDQSQDCSQFSQFTLASHGDVTVDTTPTSSPEEEGKPQLSDSEKELNCRNEKELQGDSNVPDTEKSKSKNESINEAIERRITESNVGEMVDSDKDLKENEAEMEDRDRGVEVEECDFFGVVESSQNEDRKLCHKAEPTVSDEVDTDDEMISGDGDEEVTSPDVIPSSQTPSFESPFQSLRRITVPLDSILAGSVQTRTNNQRKLKREQNDVENSDGKDVETVSETQVESDVLDDDKVSSCDSPMKGEKQLIIKTKVSPVAGRTRRKLQRKIEMTHKLEKPQEEPTEQEVSRIMLSSKQLAETGKLSDQTPSEEATEPFVAGVTRDETLSPVFSAKSKFLRPFAAGGSPCRSNLLGRNSPGVSPTTGILKRYHGNKQGVDSPSPPGKVRRVSFALPEKHDGSEDLQEESAEPSTNAAQLKTSRSSPFTAVKQRRPLPASNAPVAQDSTDCVFPDLISCTVPVEQILPSILTMSWSRGMGHLVRAQNIHTIGNLSALKEEQVRNLPIKSPKVPTLKKALRRFHQSQKGRNSKSIMTKLTPEATHKEDSENKEEDAATSECTQLPGEADLVIEPVGGEDPPSSGGAEGQQTAAESRIEGIKPSEECLSSKPDPTLVVETADMASDARSKGSEAEIVFVDDDKMTDLPTVEARGDKMGMEAGGMGPYRPAHGSDVIEGTADMQGDSGDEGNIDIKGTELTEAAVLAQESPEHPSASTTSIEGGSDKERFCNCLSSLKDLALPDVLQTLSSEEIFEAHHSLTEIISVVVQALKGRWQSPRSKKQAFQDVQ